MPLGPHVIEGIGDDCAVLRVGDRTLLVSCDLSIENVHFRRSTLSPMDIGYKAGASAFSDIAAMGGLPLFCLISFACPPDTDTDLIEGIYEGLLESATVAGAVIVGGDTTSAPGGITIDVTVIGEMAAARYLPRRGARVGDRLAVIGALGLSAAGLMALERGEEAPDLARAHARPEPRFMEGEWLCGEPGVRAMIDVSDGLLQDASHLCEAGDLGVDIGGADVPLTPLLRAFCTAHDLEPLRLALTGGEDYALAFAIDPAACDAVFHRFRQSFNATPHVVGTFTDAWKGARVDGDVWTDDGFDHFQRR